MPGNRTVTRVAVAALPIIYLGSVAAVPAAADSTPSWYVGGNGAAVFQNKADTSAGTLPKSSFKDGYGVGGTLGYSFGNGFRAEAELGYQNSRIKSGSGHMSALYGMASGYYDFNLGGPIKPYVGAGLGYANVRLNGTPNGGVSVDDSDNVLAYQLSAGVGYDLSQQTTLYVGYRYMGTQKPSFNDAAGRSFNSQYSNNSVLAGIRVKF